MKSILIVRRPFKSMGQYYPLGSIIEDPGRVKTLRMKMREGKVVELYEGHERFESTIKYIEIRAGRKIREEVLAALRVPDVQEKESEKVEPKKEEPKKEEPATAKPKAQKAKPKTATPKKAIEK